VGRILSTHTGSLPRPDGLKALMYEQEEGKPVDRGRLEEAEREAVADVVRRQAEAGIDIVSDGEMSKPGFVNYVTSRLTGLDGDAPPWTLEDLSQFPELLIEQYGGEAGAHIVVKSCTGPITYVGTEAVQRDIEVLKEALAATPGAGSGFLPAASPGCIAMACPNHHYGSYEDYLFALARAMRSEYQAIVDADLLLQIDSPDLAMAPHTKTWDDAIGRLGLQGYIELHMAAIDEAVAGLDPDRLRTHVCWGNYTGPHQMDVPLTDVLPGVLAARPRAVSFEAANARHEHEWADLATMAIPQDKVLVPGVIDTKTNVLEHPRLVAQRLGHFVDLVGPDRVIGGTDCGFGTFVGFGAVHPAVAWLKLEALGEGARLASGQPV
jgi:5-methyltetrahydropteroyltriglutamate--homocysteine methyltransferase